MIKTFPRVEIIGAPRLLNLAQPNCLFSSLEHQAMSLSSFLFPLSSAFLEVHP